MSDYNYMIGFWRGAQGDEPRSDEKYAGSADRLVIVTARRVSRVMAGSMLDHVVWGEYWMGTEGGIYRYWRALKSADPPQYLGPPIGPETDVGDGVVQQPFASGAVIQWSPEGGGVLANDPL